jgi:photosystem II stability/assembly factor-like uncharacterized protein
MRPARLLLALLAALALASCGDDDAAPEPAATAPPAAEDTAEPAPADEPAAPADDGGASPYIGSLTVDPGDGTLMIGTGLGLYRLEPGEQRARRIEGALETPEGAGTISANLELLHLGPGELLASGHPESGQLPEDIGLVRSGDHGDTWTPVSGLGEFDWHVLERSRGLLAGVPADGTDLFISRDAGKAFSRNGVAPSPPVDLAIDPADPERWAASTAEGIATSEDGGATWRPREPMPDAQLAWPEPGALYRVDQGGLVWVSEDGGETWQERGDAGGSPSTLDAGSDGALYLALPGAVIKRSTDGGRTWKEVTTLD